MTALDYLNKLSSLLRPAHQRFAVQLKLSNDDCCELLERYIQSQSIDIECTAWLGGNKNLFTGPHYSFKQGQRLLGNEVQLLVVDLSEGFDANSFNAALGALIGGGILFITQFESLPETQGKQWLATHFNYWPCIESLTAFPFLISESKFTKKTVQYSQKTSQQVSAIKAIEKVVTGHRRRPLVLNANRGRGKTASLGMAAAKLMSERVMTIVVTAPSITALSPLFEFVEKSVGELVWVSQTRTDWVLSNGSQLRFLAPDDLNLSNIEADLVFVDEAAALPLPMLINFARRFHRLVFSSTIHGYEGCGRGFTIKFMQWLNYHRPGWKELELTQPIRWAENDPLENWSFDAFLLNADNAIDPQNLSTLDDRSLEFDLDDIRIESVSKQQLLDDTILFRSIFGLLVTAHYQTSPNDVVQVLESQEIQVYQICYQPKNGYLTSELPTVIGCMLVSFEGGLEEPVIIDIQQGLRRPKGHLAAVHLTNHLAINQPAQQTSARIMRIAIMPSWQGRGIGTLALMTLESMLKQEVDFLSVSFGATSELVQFWKQSFQLVSIGTRRDHASGCYSAFMVRALSVQASDWIREANQRCLDNFQRILPLQYQELEHTTLVSLLQTSNVSHSECLIPPMLYNYALGGNSFESVVPYYIHFLLEYLSKVNPFLSTASQHEVIKKQLLVVIDKVLLFHSWQYVASKHQLAGRKKIEQILRDWLRQFTV